MDEDFEFLVYSTSRKVPNSQLGTCTNKRKNRSNITHKPEEIWNEIPALLDDLSGCIYSTDKSDIVDDPSLIIDVDATKRSLMRGKQKVVLM